MQLKSHSKTVTPVLVFDGEGTEPREGVKITYISTPSKNGLPIQCMDLFIKQACR